MSAKEIYLPKELIKMIMNIRLEMMIEEAMFWHQWKNPQIKWINDDKFAITRELVDREFKMKIETCPSKYSNERKEFVKVLIIRVDYWK